MSFGSSFRLGVCACLGLAFLAPNLATVTAAEIAPVVAVEPARQALDAGLELETQRRWIEGIRHYEEATRKFPEDALLEQRLLVCRIHADIERRYQDQSFLTSLGESSTERVLDLYAEVLSNLETYYVDLPNWAALQRHGTAFLEVALTEPLFLERNLPGADREAIERFRLNVHRYIQQRPISTRYDLRANAAYVAGLARQELGLAGTATAFEYVCGAIGLLDPYTRYLTPQQLDETFSNIEGNFVGLGVELKVDEGQLRIVSVIPGGPAAEGGVKSEETILAVNQAQSSEHAPEALADMLRGPEGSWVTLTLQNAQSGERTLYLQRRRVEVPCVENVHIVDTQSGVGYLRLTAFQKTTVTDLDAAIWKLQSQGLRKLIIDLRGNPGGLLQAAVEAADRFLDQGKIVTTHGRNTRENFDYVAHSTRIWSGPLVVLIDRDSASASEIFAGAIRDHNRGRIVGETSYGKGSVQGIFRLQAMSCGLCLTTAKFYSPLGFEINRHGVQPHDPVDENTVVTLRPDPTNPQNQIGNDRALAKAVEVARDTVLVSQGRRL